MNQPQPRPDPKKDNQGVRESHNTVYIVIDGPINSPAHTRDAVRDSHNTVFIVADGPTPPPPESPS